MRYSRSFGILGYTSLSRADRVVSPGLVVYPLFPSSPCLPRAWLPGLGLSFLSFFSSSHTRPLQMSPGLPRSPSGWRNLSWASSARIASPSLLHQLGISEPAPPQAYGLPCCGHICLGVLPRNGSWKGSPFSQTSSFSNPVCLDWACCPERLCGVVFDFLFLGIYSSYWRMAVTLVSREPRSASRAQVSWEYQSVSVSL